MQIGRLRRRPAKLLVEPRQVRLLQVAIGRLQVADALPRELLHEAVLQRAIDPLATLGLRTMGLDQFYVQLAQGTAELRLRLNSRENLVRRGLPIRSINAVAIHVQGPR